jgi:hypothetical protein
MDRKEELRNIIKQHLKLEFMEISHNKEETEFIVKTNVAINTNELITLGFFAKGKGFHLLTNDVSRDYVTESVVSTIKFKFGKVDVPDIRPFRCPHCYRYNVSINAERNIFFRNEFKLVLNDKKYKITPNIVNSEPYRDFFCGCCSKKIKKEVIPKEIINYFTKENSKNVYVEKNMLLDLVDLKLRGLTENITNILRTWKYVSIKDFLKDASDGTIEEAEMDAITLKSLVDQREETIHYKKICV